MAIWPSTQEEIQANLHRESNDYLLNHSGISQHLIGGDGTAMLSFVPRTAKEPQTAVPVELISHW